VRRRRGERPWEVVANAALVLTSNPTRMRQEVGPILPQFSAWMLSLEFAGGLVEVPGALLMMLILRALAAIPRQTSTWTRLYDLEFAQATCD
jgi:hypothetical protein